MLQEWLLDTCTRTHTPKSEYLEVPSIYSKLIYQSLGNSPTRQCSWTRSFVSYQQAPGQVSGLAPLNSLAPLRGTAPGALGGPQGGSLGGSSLGGTSLGGGSLGGPLGSSLGGTLASRGSTGRLSGVEQMKDPFQNASPLSGIKHSSGVCCTWYVSILHSVKLL